jgi:ABC-type multidrug transport system fused ATPase/permease subunit
MIDIEDAAKKANAFDFINSLPNKFATQVGQNGILLSGGQKQRIAIARAILKNAPILLLDEATSALDSESESLIQQSFNKLAANKTTIVIAHRLSTVVDADQIIVVDNGEIIEKGTHDDLLNKNGAYFALFNSQFKN